jgi:type VI secretion system secreted protein Hcp
MAAVDYFLKIAGTDGESKVAGYENWIQIESFSWGATQSGSMAYGGGGGGGKVSMQDFHFVMKMNKSTPFLFKHCATGEHIGSADLHCRKAGGKQELFLKIKFTDILVSSYQSGGSTGGGDPLPMEQLSLNFAKVEFEYLMQDEKGITKSAGKTGWDQKTTQSS